MNLNHVRYKFLRSVRYCYLVLFLTLSWSISAHGFDKVVIWGHKLHSHTHSYIHERFYRAFDYLGCPVHWFDNNDNVQDFDFSDSLFITEGQVDALMPIRNDCKYILHNCNLDKYRGVKESNCLIMQVYNNRLPFRDDLIKVDTCMYYDVPNRTVYMPWAADMLPHEIEEMKAKIGEFEKDACVHWIGTLGGGVYGNINELLPFSDACVENGISFLHTGNPWVKGLSREDCNNIIARSYFFPAIVGTWQVENGYIPCRIFIAICLGQMGITNAKSVYELFDGNVVYNENTHQLFYDALERAKTWTLQDQLALMDFVKEKHTYLNRIKLLLDFFELMQSKGSSKED